MERFGRRVFADNDIHTSHNDLKNSLKGMKAELEAARRTLTRHNECKLKNKLKYYSVGADMARKVLRLERIVRDMEIATLTAKLKELRGEAAKKYSWTGTNDGSFKTGCRI